MNLKIKCVIILYRMPKKLELSPEEFVEHHKSNVRKAAKKYYEKMFKCDADNMSDDEKQAYEERIARRKAYHAERYKARAETIKAKAAEYRAKKKQEKINKQNPTSTNMLLSEPSKC